MRRIETQTPKSKGRTRSEKTWMGSLNEDAETKIRLRVTLRRVLTIDEYWWTWEMKNRVEVKTRTLSTDWLKWNRDALKSLWRK